MSSEKQWACTKRQMVDALAHITVQPVTLPGREARVVVAGEMADAILAQLPEMPAGMVLVGREDLRVILYDVIPALDHLEAYDRLVAAERAQP